MGKSHRAIGRTPNPGAWSVLGSIVAIWLAGTAIVSAFHITLPTTTSHPSVVARPIAQAAPTVAITPGLWTMVAGQSVVLNAYMATAAGDCLPAETVFSWQLLGLSDLLGYLNTTAGESDQFRSYDFVSGTAVVQVSAIGLEWCGWALMPFTSFGTVGITDVSPLYVSSLHPAPDPARPGEPTVLSGQIAGGFAPYNLTVAFGDGSGASEELPAAGAFAVAHEYADGAFRPTVRVTDALGDHVSAGSETDVVATPALAVLPTCPQPLLEVGRPALLNASVLGGSGPYQVVWNDSWGGTHTGPGWWIDPELAGVLVIEVHVTDAMGTTATRNLTVTVEPPIDLSVRPLRTSEDVGEPLPLALAITGGVPPFWVNGSAAPAGSRFSFTAAYAGTSTEVLVPSTTGMLWSEVSVTDALGGTAWSTIAVADVAPVPALTFGASPRMGEVGAPIDLVGTVSGTGPYDWNLSSSALLANATPLTPARNGPAIFAWTGVPRVAGPIAFELTATDVAGETTVANLTVDVAPLLAIHLVPLGSNLSAGATLPVAISVGGGVPPYTVALTTSGGQFARLNFSAGGFGSWTSGPAAAGTFTLAAFVTDAEGAVQSSTLSLPIRSLTVPPANGTAVPPPPAAAPRTAPAPSAPEAPRPLDLAGFASGLGAGVFAAMFTVYLLGRRRRRPATPVAPPPVSSAALDVVRRVLLDAEEGLDMESLLVLCEEEGLERSQARAALDRWERRGRVVPSDSSAEGSVLRWNPESREDEGSNSNRSTGLDGPAEEP